MSPGAAGFELGQLTRLVLGPARLVAQLDGLLELADRRQVPRERLAQRQHEPAARTPDLRSQLGQLRLPGRQRVVCARTRAQTAQQLVALLQRPGVGAGDRRVARPGARDGAIEVAAAQCGRALHDRQALGREDEDGGVLGQRLDRRAGRAVDRGPLGRAGLEADRPVRRHALAAIRAARRA